MGLGLKKRLRLRNRVLRGAARERGAELVEAAIVLPVLLSLLIGIVWIARAYNVYETMTRAAREGARFAVAPSCSLCPSGNTFPSDGDVQGVINGALSASSLDPTKVKPAISIQRSQVLDSSNPTSPVSGVIIKFGYPFQFVIPFTSLNLTTITISTTVQMRQEF
jgi:hypothetical protein